MLANRRQLATKSTEPVALIKPPAVMTPVRMPDTFTWLSPTKPYDHQIAAGAWRRGRGMDGRLHESCAFEMGLGTGKTLCVVEEILKLRAKQGEIRVLILAPNAILRTVWEAQLRQHGNIKPVLLDGPMAERRIYLRAFPMGVFVHNHESLPAMHDALASMLWDMVVIDEHSKYRNYKSQRSKALLGQGSFKKVGKMRARYKIVLSGTPVIKRPTDLYAIYKWIGAPFLNITSFKNAFVVMGGYGGYEELGVKAYALPRLVAILDQHRFVVPKEAVLNIPRTPMRREVLLPDWQRAIYKRVQNELATKYRNPNGVVEMSQIFNRLTELLRLAQVTAGIEAISTDKYTWRDDHAKALELFGKSKNELDEDSLLGSILAEDGNVILWCWYRAELIEYARMLRERGVTSVTYSGQTKPHEKVKNEADFNEGRAQVFIGQIAAAGLGLNLPTARTMVYVTRSYDTEGFIQSLDRNSRMTTKHKSLQVVYVEAKQTVDQHIRKTLEQDASLGAKLSSIDLASILGLKPEQVT